MSPLAESMKTKANRPPRPPRPPRSQGQPVIDSFVSRHRCLPSSESWSSAPNDRSTGAPKGAIRWHRPHRPAKQPKDQDQGVDLFSTTPVATAESRAACITYSMWIILTMQVSYRVALQYSRYNCLYNCDVLKAHIIWYTPASPSVHLLSVGCTV